jgi:anthranilate phosphoribosyltransferase
VSRGLVTEHDIDPRELGIKRSRIGDLVGSDPEHNATVVHRMLSGQVDAVRDIVLLNAAAGLLAFDLAKDPAQAQVNILDRFRRKMAVAAETVDSGAATAKLAEWVAASRE